VRFVCRLAAVSTSALAVLVAAAQPASAHEVPGTEASNFETTVDRITPRMPGLTVRPVDLGNELELRNETGADVVVLGYQGEPYLRVGSGGVLENRRSPATYLNRTRDGKTRVPASADAAAAPEWHHIGSGTTARWHDHRAHWMGSDDPRAVARDPDQRHLIDRWQVPLRRGAQEITVTGDLVWVPGPSPWGWLLVALTAGAAVVALSRTRWWRSVLAGALGVVIVSESAHVVASWSATTASLAGKLGASVYSIGGIALAVIALIWIVVRPPFNAIPAVLFAGLIIAVAGGLGDLTTLTRSQLPTELPATVARLEVALALGLGAGLAVAAALRLRPPSAPAAAEHEPSPDRSTVQART
jgi:hypothetical protein